MWSGVKSCILVGHVHVGRKGYIYKISLDLFVIIGSYGLFGNNPSSLRGRSDIMMIFLCI